MDGPGDWEIAEKAEQGQEGNGLGTGPDKLDELDSMYFMKRNKDNFALAVLVLLINIAILLTGVVVLGLEPHIPILLNIGLTLCYGVFLGLPWSELIGGMQKSVADSIGVVLIVLMVGVVVGTWTMCGMVPMIIYYGLMFFSPGWFLVSIMILCFLLAFITGSSWTTAGTLGIAFLGVGISLGIPAGLTVGCILSGALCGDIQSPFGAATNLTAAVSKVDLHDTVKSLTYITVPCLLVCGILFAIMGVRYGKASGDSAQVEEIMKGLETVFHFHPVLILPAVLMLVMIVLKIPTVPTLILASVCGVALSVWVQGNTFSDSLLSMYSGYESHTGVELLDTLLTRGGLMSMDATILLIILALALAGCLECTGVMKALSDKIGVLLRGRCSLVVTTFVMATLLDYFTADCHTAIVLSANGLKDKYDQLGIDKCVLARTIHYAATGLEPLLPWTLAGVYLYGTLGVHPWEYAPYYFMAAVMTVVVLFGAVTGITVPRTKTKNWRETE